jgi:hypothetical protein
VCRRDSQAQALAEALDGFAGVLRGGRPDPDGPPLEALPSSWRVKRVLERRAETEDEVEEEWSRLPGEAREGPTLARMTVALPLRTRVS